MKPASKNTKPKKKVETRGGYRANAGRKATITGERSQVHIDLETIVIEKMLENGITNKTEYIANLIKKDLGLL